MKKQHQIETSMFGVDLQRQILATAETIARGMVQAEVAKAMAAMKSFAKGTLKTYEFGVPIEALLAPERKSGAKILDRGYERVPKKERKSTRGAPQCACDQYEESGKHAAKCPAKRKQRTRRKHSEKFKAKVVSHVQGGFFASDVSERYDINESLLRRWCAEAGVTPPSKRQAAKDGAK